MKKTNKKWLNRLLLFVSVLGLIGGSLFLYQWYLSEKYTGYQYYTGKAKIDSYQIIADGKGAIVHWDVDQSEETELRKYNKQLFTEWRNPTSQNYILRDNMKLPKHPSDIHESIGKDAYWTLSIYKVEGNKLKEEPEIDLLATVDEYKKGYISNDIGTVYSYKGKDLLALYIRPLENHEKKKKVFLNLQTRKIEEVKAIENIKFPYSTIKLSNLSDFGIKSDVFGFHFAIKPGEMVDTPISKDKNAMNILEKENSQVVILTNENSFDTVDRIASVYSKFLPNDYNLYRDSKIPKEFSTDGQDHAFSSKEEFDKYFDVEKVKNLYHLND
ncbi:hypothetical protein [Streptococcus sanguinis]|jgi:hypothetical protein|uniref:hypothetical protein n=1 Tax=Streptococcus sanguinis TaxID=1305 RepID=UPI00066C2E82|nr:hypothetical protein [Streptococcus sanguinis]